MANKDITATVIANILNLIKTASAFANATVKETKSYKEGISRLGKGNERLRPTRIFPEPDRAQKELQTWFNKYIKPGATSAGTATVSSKFTTTAQWRTDFFNTRTELLANASPEAIAALDSWFAKYTSYKVEFKK